MIELAITYGAEIASVPFVDVLGTADKRMIAMFLDKGADPITQFPFAHAFHELRAKTRCAFGREAGWVSGTIFELGSCKRSLMQPVSPGLSEFVRRFAKPISPTRRTDLSRGHHLRGFLDD